MPLIPAFKIGVWNAWIFMSVFILQMIVMIFAGKHVWERSHVPAETRRSRSDKYVSLVSNLVWLAGMGYSIFLPFKLGTVWFYSGLILFIIGLAVMTIATCNFIYTPADQVITRGAYRLSRHPLYLATFFICLGSGIASASWLFILLTLIMVYCFHQEALLEEKYCLEEYNTAYQNYKNRVPRWIGIPKLK